MNYLLDKLALVSFSAIAAKNGYRFKKVIAKKEIEKANQLYAEEAFSFPDALKEKVASYKTAAVNFVAYHNGTPVGMVRLANPKIINRPYELYGMDIDAQHHEIQSLVVKKEYRDGTQFVMLGLFKAMYAYSVSHNINLWNSCGARNVYLTVRRFCKKIEEEKVNFEAINNPLTQYLYSHRIIDTYFTMPVKAFEPWGIFKHYISKSVKKLNICVSIKDLIFSPAAFIKNLGFQKN